MQIKGVVEKYNAGKWNVAGIKISGVGWYNAPEGSGLLTKDLEGEEVELQLEDLLGNGEFLVVEVKDSRGVVRKLKDRQLFVSGGCKAVAKRDADEYLVFFKEVASRIVPQNLPSTESFVVRELELQAHKVAIELWKEYRLGKRAVLNKVGS